MPLPFLPVELPAGSLGAMVFVLALAPYRLTRNPVYRMLLGLIGLAIAFDNPLAAGNAGALRVRHPLRRSAREEAYLERKFGDVCRRYHTRVRRWL